MELKKEDKILFKLIEIIQLNNEPIKLFFLCLKEISILFELHSQNIIQDSSKISMNIFYLEVVLSKIIFILDKFIKKPNYEIYNIEFEKIISILNNFYLDFSEIKPIYLNFYLKFMYFCLINTKFKVEFKIKKKLISQFYSFIFDIIQNYSKYEKNFNLNLPQDFIKLIEIIIIFFKNFGKLSIEDIFIINKMTRIVIKKINNENINSNMNSDLNSKSNLKNVSFMQISMIYFLVNFVFSLFTS
jgi:hypothetical protein